MEHCVICILLWDPKLLSNTVCAYCVCRYGEIRLYVLYVEVLRD